MTRKDDRTEQQRQTHTVLIKGRDRFLSGWGGAVDGYSVAAWACKPEDAHKVEQWVRNRSDMQYVAVVGNDYRPPRSTSDFHIYYVRENHPALD